MIIETNRLLLVPMTIDFIDGVISGDIKAYSLFDIKTSGEWPTDEIYNVLLRSE